MKDMPTCPTCGRRLEGLLTEWPNFPFCSKKCRMIDLGRWVTGDYAIEAVEPDEESIDPDEPS